ncbi:hypothetical protein [Prochlorococcus sp. MIT 1307]|uniref:hypothetical protein n=1 Tax=Prochlorococcus sp. MIT 1307 TaxID=3096219 RepID=UPI002A7669BA|nr:hypothetical protein [Prochlorococcus sp. MIT 1307]
MDKFIRGTLAVCLGLVLILQLCANTVNAATPIMYEGEEEKQQLEIPQGSEKINIDDLLGPEVDFPFRPENHRDNSNPIGRIGPINDANL